MSQLDIPAQPPAQQQKYIYMSKSMYVEPARHTSSTASSTAKVHIYVKIKVCWASSASQLNRQLNSKNTYTYVLLESFKLGIVW